MDNRLSRLIKRSKYYKLQQSSSHRFHSPTTPLNRKPRSASKAFTHGGGAPFPFRKGWRLKIGRPRLFLKAFAPASLALTLRNAYVRIMSFMVSYGRLATMHGPSFPAFGSDLIGLHSGPSILSETKYEARLIMQLLKRLEAKGKSADLHQSLQAQ